MAVVVDFVYILQLYYFKSNWMFS